MIYKQPMTTLQYPEKDNKLLDQIDEELSHVRKEIQRNKKRKLELEELSEKELMRQKKQKNISDKELQRNLESQIDELIRQIPFKNELRYDKLNSRDMQIRKDKCHELGQLRRQNQRGKLCRWCGEMDGKAGFRCSCNDI